MGNLNRKAIGYGITEKDHFVFEADNVSTTWGNPHPKTGNHSIFGEFHRFESKKIAEAYAENSRKLVTKVGRAATLRKYDLGYSVHDYLISLASLGYGE